MEIEKFVNEIKALEQRALAAEKKAEEFDKALKVMVKKDRDTQKDLQQYLMFFSETRKLHAQITAEIEKR